MGLHVFWIHHKHTHKRARDLEKGKKEKIVEKENKSIYVILEENDFVARAQTTEEEEAAKKNHPQIVLNLSRPLGCVRLAILKCVTIASLTRCQDRLRHTGI